MQQKQIQKPTGVNTLEFAKYSDGDELNIDKLKTVPIYLSKLGKL